ncbi:MAG: diguanylate cyclase [Anaerotignum sp.]|nr:diguanylate cyclase [Anaerotignum sp.]
MRRKQFVLIFYIVVLSVIIFVGGGAVRFFQSGRNEAQLEKKAEINEGWSLKEEKTAYSIEKLPQMFSGVTGIATLSRQLPENLNSNSVLAFENYFQDVQVVIDGEERYSYDGLLSNMNRRLNTNFFCMVDLDEEDRGKTIEVTFHAPSDKENIALPGFRIGTEMGILLEFFRLDVLSLVFSGIMVFFAVLFFAIFIRERYSKGENCSILAHSAILMALSSIWSIANSSVVHMCVHNDILLAYLSFHSFMLLPVAIPIFYCDVMEGHKKFLYQLAGVASFNFILQNIFFFVGKYQYIEMMRITFIVLLFIIFALMGISIREFVKRDFNYAVGFLIATAVFGGCYILDVFRFFFYAPLDNAMFFRYGVLAFISIIFWIFARRMLCYVEVEVENRVYKELALRDVLTHLPNRTALEKRIKSLEEKERVCSSFTVILMDVNGLKPVNDKSGHGAGDRLLCEAAKSIQEAFPEEKDAWYRLGGDEFIVLMTETELNNEECQQRLLRATEKWKNADYGPISISCGSKTVKNLKITREAVGQLMHEADQMMYKNKILYYQKKLNKKIL